MFAVVAALEKIGHSNEQYEHRQTADDAKPAVVGIQIACVGAEDAGHGDAGPVTCINSGNVNGFHSGAHCYSRGGGSVQGDLFLCNAARVNKCQRCAWDEGGFNHQVTR